MQFIMVCVCVQLSQSVWSYIYIYIYILCMWIAFNYWLHDCTSWIHAFPYWLIWIGIKQSSEVMGRFLQDGDTQIRQSETCFVFFSCGIQWFWEFSGLPSSPSVKNPTHEKADRGDVWGRFSMVLPGAARSPELRTCGPSSLPSGNQCGNGQFPMHRTFSD